MTGRMQQKDSKEEIMKIFSLFDEDNQGKISFRNLKKIAQELGETLSDEDLYISHVDNVNFTRLWEFQISLDVDSDLNSTKHVWCF